MKKTRAKKPTPPKAVQARAKRRAAHLSPRSGLSSNPPTRSRRLPHSKRSAEGAQALRPSIAQALCWRRRRERTTTPILAEASELGWTVDNYPPRDLLKHGKIR